MRISLLTLLPIRKYLLTLISVFFLCSYIGAQNPIETENGLTGNPSSEWDINGAGDLTIQGFATDMSVNKGQPIHFKIDVTDASAFTIRIYRIGYYQGNGARLVVNLGPFTGTAQPAPLSDNTTGLLDCGNWSQSASWAVPQTAVSGVYIAKLTKTVGGGSSHITFIVRDDASTSDLYFKTSDATWQAYNVYGGNSLYVGNAIPGRATKVSYNRPLTTRGGGGGGGAEEDAFFNAEYPMVRWLEKNGYNVTYTTDLDADRNGNLIAGHKVFLSVGHDEYWSFRQRSYVEAARDAGVNLAFFSGNEIYWKTRWENSIDGSNTPYRTLVCYKEGSSGENTCGGKCDPKADEWTGLWRNGCEFPLADGCKPENALSGQISWDGTSGAIKVPDNYKNMRFWRNTSIAGLGTGQTATLPDGTLGYEWDWEQDAYKKSYPPGRILLSNTFQNGHTHKLSLYRHSGGALVFGAGTVQWSWGLDNVHDRGNLAADIRMQQATVNLLADMNVQPATPQPGIVPATASTDAEAPTTTISSPANNAIIAIGTAVTITGTATDINIVAGVEVSVDGGTTWQVATGGTTWSYTWTPLASGIVVIKSRGFDDSGNMEAAGSGSSPNVTTVTVGDAPPVICPCTIFKPSDAPASQRENDAQGIEVGVKFRTLENGFITGIRFYKGTNTTGTHIGHLWSSTGIKLAEATFTNETASGWQQVTLANPVAVSAGVTYVASFHSSSGDYPVTNPFFTQTIINGPLTTLANGEDGPNGLYTYSPVSVFPTSNYQTSNYWVDVVFDNTTGPDLTPPNVLSTKPVANASGVSNNLIISAVFNEALDAATVNNSTFQLANSNSIIPATVNYDAATQKASLTPLALLDYSTNYQLIIKGGTTDPRMKDLAGNSLAANYIWSFTTGTQPPSPSSEGPGGPILVISAASNPFSRYPVEILRAEGLNAFRAKDISQISAGELPAYDAIILGEMPLTTGQVTMLTNWVTSGGTLIAMRPGVQLSALMGITVANGVLSNKYLKVNTASAQGDGIVNETIQFHGAANLYTLNGATALATLYSDAINATANPAVTIHNVGSNGGQAIAFAYDLARSVVYTRQGNPAWSGQERDGQSGPIRSNDLFYGNAAADPQPDWVDLNKVAIPQADEQQRLLTNIIIKGNSDKKPLPRFWFLPRGLKAVVVMTGDDHGSGGTIARFNHYKTLGLNTPEAVNDWRAVRGSSYIYTSTPITNSQAAAFESDGFEIGIHLNTGCANWTPSSLTNFFTDQLGEFASKYSGIPTPVTHRTHCIAWSDWASQARIESEKGIRLDVNYYYWPGAWIQNRPGMFTGSGMPMRFADLDGSIIDCYQVATQMTDESNQVFPGFAEQLLQKAVGPEGYYGAFCANMHTDADNSPGSEAIINAALARNVPVISAKQMLTWLDGRNASTFSEFTWSGNQLSFNITSAAGTQKLEAMLPAQAGNMQLISITANGASHSFRKEIIKGIEYAFFSAATATYIATYEEAVACTPPTGRIAAPSFVCKGEPVTLTLAEATGVAPFDLVINGVTYNDINIGQTIATFAPAEKSIWGSTGSPANADVSDGGQAIETGTKFRSSTSGYINGIRFYKGTTNTGAHIARLWSSTGTKLAEATFTNETGSGWQEVRFSVPVAITANLTYIASYFSPSGGFAITPNFFTGTGVNNAPLSALQAGIDGPNGVYKYGGGFPDAGNTANYWVDVLFTEVSNASSYTYLLTNIVDNSACTNAGDLSTVTVAVKPLPEGTLADGGLDCQGNINLKFNAAAGTGPFTLVINNNTYNNITSGTLFSTGSAAPAESTIWPAGTVGGEPGVVDNGAIELGIKFRTSISGTVTGIRFYKRTGNTGTHTGSLWSSNGSLLASAIFSNETASGWQQVVFSTPVSIQANTTYIASYYAPAGQYAFTANYFSNNGVTSGPLTALQSGVDGGNGVFKAGSGFPAQSFNSANYWVDVVFKPGAPLFNLTSITDAGNCTNTGNLGSVSSTGEAPLLVTYYRDADGDGFGKTNETIVSCSLPAGYVINPGDCDDADAAIYPGATEICDSKDNNCNGSIDEGVANTPPVVPPLNDIRGECTATAPVPVINDNCYGLITGTTADPLTYNTQGAFVITWSFNNGNGGISTATQNVIIDDVTAPVVPVLANITGECTATATAPTTTDNCSGSITGMTTNALTYTTQGTHIITWTFNDGNGNISTATQNVIIDDITAPVIPLLATITGQCSATATVPTTTDNCLGSITGTTTNALTYTTQGTHTITWTFNDGNGNISTATQNVVIDDVTAPVIPLLATITGQCSATATAPTIPDNCSASITGTTTNALTYTAQGTHIITWTFNDGNGNISTATQNVVIDDITAPVVPVLATITGECSATATAPTTTDNCSGSITGTTTNPLTYTTQGTHIITWTFNDGNGNISTATQNVVIDDVTAPVIPLLANITGQCSATATAPTIPDNCSGSITGTTTNALTYTTQGTHTITWTFNDGNGNISTATQNVIIDDITAPVIPLLATITGQCSATATAPTIPDNCSGSITGTTTNALTYTAQGTHIITWTFNDGNGNISTATQNVVIDDITAPVVPVLATITGQCSATATAPTTTDNCSGSITGTTTNPLTYTTQGTHIITWTFNDGNGNISTAIQNVVIDDVTAPVVPVLANITGECTATATAPTTTDNCSGTITGTTTNALTYTTQGTHTITWTFNDGNGNISTATQNVVIDDITAPGITGCPSNISTCNPVVSWVAPSVSDNCSGSIITSDHTPGETFPAGITTLTYTATDLSGNITTCSFTVTVVQPAIVDAPANQVICNNSATTTVIFSGAGNGSTYNWTNDNTSIGLAANGSGNIVTFNASNSGTYQQVATITVTPVVNGCTGISKKFTISVNPTPSIPVITVVNNCGMSTLSTTATGSLLWSTGETTSSINVSNAGTYTLKQTVNGCTSAVALGVATPGDLPAAPAVTVVNNCTSSTLSIPAGGTILWSNGATTASITVNTPGIYTVTRTVSRCVSAVGSGVAAPQATRPIVTVVNNCGTSTLTTTASGIILWSTGTIGPSITVSKAGTYSVRRIFYGCISAAGTAIAAPKPIPAKPLVTVVNSCGSSTLSIPTGGSILWSNGATTNSITVTTGGIYTVKRISGDCSSPSGSGTAAPYAIPAAPVVTVVNSCGSSKLSVPAGGTILWSNGATTSSITVTIPGTYTVKRTSGGCSGGIGSGTAAPYAIPASPVVTVVNSCGSSTLSIPTGGTILWSNGATTNSITVTTPGTYNVRRTSGGCSSGVGSGTAAPSAIPATPVITVINRCGSSTLSIPAGGTILWSNGATTNAITTTIPGIYTVKRTLGACFSASGSGVAAPYSIPATPVVTVTNSCGSSTLSVPTGGSILWSTGATTASITVTTAGTYTVKRTSGTCTSTPGSGTAVPARAPVIIAGDISVSTSSNNCNASVAFASNVSITGTPAPVVVYKIGSITITSPRVFPVGNTTVTVSATNSCGTATKSFLVRVSDKQYPSVICKPHSTRTINSSTYTISGNEFNASASDNCGTPSLIYKLSGATDVAYNSSNTSLAGVKLNQGYTAITWKATDGSGNITTCYTIVNVCRENSLITSAVAPKFPSDNKWIDPEWANLKVKVMPNPTSYYFTLEVISDSKEDINITIVDATGRLIEQKTGVQPNSNIQLGKNYRTGAYIAELRQGKNKVVVRLIKIAQ